MKVKKLQQEYNINDSNTHTYEFEISDDNNRALGTIKVFHRELVEIERAGGKAKDYILVKYYTFYKIKP